MYKLPRLCVLKHCSDAPESISGHVNIELNIDLARLSVLTNGSSECTGIDIWVCKIPRRYVHASVRCNSVTPHLWCLTDAMLSSRGESLMYNASPIVPVAVLGLSTEGA